MGEEVRLVMNNLEGVLLNPLEIVSVAQGDIFHGVKSKDKGFKDFGEAYFSSINYGMTKAWKRHRKMTLNIIVPVGKIRFVIFDDREKSITYGKFQEIVLSKENYFRLTIPPMLWLGFQGIGKMENILLNIADIVHNPKEADRKERDQIQYNWRIV